MTQHQNITAIILAGGKSSRMGEEKGLVLFKEKPLVLYVIAAAKEITDNIIIITANPAYQQFSCRCIEDALKDKGPLGGIYTGLINSGTQKNLLLGCDMPFLTGNLLRALAARCGEEDVLLTEHKGLAEPLCSVYDNRCAAAFRGLLEQDQLKITDALAGLKTRVISFDKEDWFRGNEFANINTIEELNKFSDGNTDDADRAEVRG
ncbi:MAG: molybdenum cofactor guanylyltransferase [Chitinophagaceae bacterium]